MLRLIAAGLIISLCGCVKRSPISPSISAAALSTKLTAEFYQPYDQAWAKKDGRSIKQLRDREVAKNAVETYNHHSRLLADVFDTVVEYFKYLRHPSCTIRIDSVEVHSKSATVQLHLFYEYGFAPNFHDCQETTVRIDHWQLVNNKWQISNMQDVSASSLVDG